MVTNQSKNKKEDSNGSAIFKDSQRKHNQDQARLVYEEITQKSVKKLKGGQPLTWLKTIERDLNSIDLTLNKASKIAQDRDKYHQEIVVRVMDKAESITSQVED